MSTPNPEGPDGADDAGGLDRRSFLQSTGAATVGAALGTTGAASADRGATSPDAGTTSELTNTSATADAVSLGPEELSLGGRHVVGDTGYPTIEDAWNVAGDGDVVYVSSSYDAESAGESFPIVLDFRDKEVLLTGGHPSGSVIDARHTDENVIEVVGKGHSDYRNNPLVQNLKVVGGNVGMVVRGAPYASFKDLVFWMTGSHGVVVDDLTVDGTFYGAFGVTFRNVVAWNCGGDGFRLNTSAHPHSTSFYGCHALLNGSAGVQLRGYASRWHGGTIQNNGGAGVDTRSGCSQLVQGTYFEGNDTSSDAPMGVYVDDNADGFTLEGSYFQGGFFRDFSNGRDKSRWGIVVAGASHVDVRNCSFRNYTDSFLHVRDATDADVHLASHCGLDDTTPLDHGGCLRLRSDGRVLPTDLRDGAPAGRFVGDEGVHDGSGGAPFGTAVWDGSAWVSSATGSAL